MMIVLLIASVNMQQRVEMIQLSPGLYCRTQIPDFLPRGK